MKILLVNTRHYLGGGDSTYSFNLANLLISKGHEVAFFAMQDERNLPDPNTDLFVSYIDFRLLNQQKNPINGLKVLSRSIYSVEAREKFKKLLERFQPDIIHLQNIHAHITPSIILEAKKHKLPIVWTLHDFKLVCPNSHYLIDATGTICEACGAGRYYQAILKCCKKGSRLASMMASLEAYAHQFMNVRSQVDSFLAPSEFMKNKLIQYGLPRSKCMHVPLFLPDEAFQNHSIENQGYYLFLGRIEPIKGITTLVQAALQAPEVRIILAGRAEPTFLQSLQPLPPNVEYVGLISGEELKRLISQCLAVVLPSICYENQPLSILEAFVAAKPVIASNLGGMTELVTNKERGLLVSPGEAVELAEAMKWMVSNPEYIKYFGDNARNYVTIMHSSTYHYDHLINIYQDLINHQIYIA